MNPDRGAMVAMEAAEALRLHREGASLDELAARFGHTRRTISRRIRQAYQIVRGEPIKLAPGPARLPAEALEGRREEARRRRNADRRERRAEDRRRREREEREAREEERLRLNAERKRELRYRNKVRYRARRRIAEVRRLRQDGWTIAGLSGRFHLSRYVVRGMVRGIEWRRGRRADEMAWPFPRRKLLAPIRPAAALAVKPMGPADRILGTPQPRGSAHGRAKLGEAQVIEARRLRSEGIPFPELSRRFGVPVNTLCYAVNGTTWGHLPGAVPSKKGGRS